MATTPGTARSSRTHSRRGSHSGPLINFNNINLFPLTSTSVDIDNDDRHHHHNNGKRNHSRKSTSYIQGASAPTTPGILSPSPSVSSYFTAMSPASNGAGVGSSGGGGGGGGGSGTSTPRRSLSRRNSGNYTPHHQHQYGHHNHYNATTTTPSKSAVQKSKSTTQLHLGDLSSSTWIHRTGTVLASETRESKGQSWLVSRASSTSLVAPEYDAVFWDSSEHQPAEDWRDRGRGHRGYQSQSASRKGSRSRRASRERAGAGEGLMMRRLVRTASENSGEGGTPHVSAVYTTTTTTTTTATSSAMLYPHGGGDPEDGYHSGNEAEEYYYSGEEDDNSPYHINSTSNSRRTPSSMHSYNINDEEDWEDDEEYLYREKGYGLGMWVDRVIGWSLFSVEEDEDEEEYRKNPYGYGRRRRARVEEAEGKGEGGVGAVKEGAEKEDGKEKSGDGEQEDDEGDGWGDPTWLFSLAAQVLF